MLGAGATVEQHGALGDERDAESLEICGPGVDDGAERLVLACEMHVPAHRVVERVERVDREDPAVAAAVVDPRERPRLGLVLVVRDPAHEQRRKPALVQVLRSLEHNQLGELIRLEPAVAIGPAVLRRDDERRVRRDHVERLAGDRLEEAAEPAVDVREAVERGVQLRERERTRIHVGRDDVARVPRGEHRLHAAARADVERPADGAARREGIAELRRRRVCGNEVGGIELGVRAGEVVRRDEEVAHRHDPPVERHLVAGGGEARRRERVDGGAAERMREVVSRHGQLEEEGAHHGAQARVGQAAVADGNVVARDPVALVAEQLDDGVLAVADTS